jgi:hypothetical protein
MITLDEFEALEPGDHIQTLPAFPPLSKEPIVLQTQERSVDGVTLTFVMTLFGVNLGSCTCTREADGGLTWALT